jgi:dTMP kinase
MPAGLFIVLEGIEGAGKTTQARLLANWMGHLGLAVTSTREPGGTAVGEAVRTVLLDRTDVEIPAETELMLVLAARAAFVQQVVRPSLAKGGVVLADRFSLSTLAYQGYGRGLELAEVRRLDAFARGGLEPDLTLVLELPPEEGARRQREAGKGRDRMERAGEEFHARVARGYRELAGSGDPRVRALDALGTPDAVHERVRDALREIFPGTFPLPQE